MVIMPEGRKPVNFPKGNERIPVMNPSDRLGSAQPRLILYLPHRPEAMEQLVLAPSASRLVEANSNHWRKIVNLLAKVASPEATDWRRFRDEALFQYTTLCFAPELVDTHAWHWIGGKENLQRFTHLAAEAKPLPNCPAVSVDISKRLLLTPYPDYRQLNNTLVAAMRSALQQQGYY